MTLPATVARAGPRVPSDTRLTMAAVNCNAAATFTRAAAPTRQASSPAAVCQPARQLRAAYSAYVSGQAVGADHVGCHRCVVGLPLLPGSH